VRPRGRSVPRTLLARSLIVCAVLGGSLVLAPEAVGAPIGSDWPMFHDDPRHLGVTLDSAIGVSTVAGLGVRWQANIGYSYVSPAVVFDSVLGRTVVYAGANNGTVVAYDAQTGDRLWYYKAGAAIQSSPAVVDGVVYIGSSDHYLYAIDAHTGALRCRFNTGGVIYAAPVVVDPDGNGKVVYVGDAGASAFDDGGRMWAINAVDPKPAADCTAKWSYGSWGEPPGSQPNVGSWSPPAFAHDVNGRPLVVFGGSSPEGAVYALDAVTGQRVWRFQTRTFTQDQDVGAGPTISLPGANGFADGVVYVAGKDSILYALNLRTGAEIWEYSIRAVAPGATRSTAALVGRTLYVGNGAPVQLFAIDAVTGTKLWSSSAAGSANGILTSPAITGPAGSRVVFVADSAGRIWAHNATTGAVLWSYATGSLIYGSPAVSGGMLFETNTAGFLYAFGLGGGSSAQPDTSIASPTPGSSVPNPNGSLTVTGSASDDTGVQQVQASIYDKNRGMYWSAATNSWTNVITLDPAALSATGARSTNWNIAFPVSANGGPFIVQAEAVDRDGQHDPSVARSDFTVTSMTSPPDTTITSPVNNKLFPFPNGVRQSFSIVASGNAVDQAGAHPGVSQVWVVVENLEHVEYYCGASGCGGGETGRYRPTYTKVPATLASPGATSTTWSLTFWTYDHPHTYKIVAWAVDRDGNPDPVRVVVNRICVNDPGATCP
jgi:outer membrane protein assembly factor BamB